MFKDSLNRPVHAQRKLLLCKNNLRLKQKRFIHWRRLWDVCSLKLKSSKKNNNTTIKDFCACNNKIRKFKLAINRKKKVLIIFEAK